MELEQAMKIASILEQDDVISPVAMACRVLLQEVNDLRLEAALRWLDQTGD